MQKIYRNKYQLMKNKIKKLSLIITACAFLLACFGVNANEKTRRAEEEKRQSLKNSELKELPGKGRLTFDYGGWLDLRYDDYQNEDNDSSTKDTYDYTPSLDLRLWLKAILRPSEYSDSKHFFYLRLKNLYIDQKPESTAGGYDHDGPHLDYAYFILDFRPCWIQTGRRYFSIGRGIAYSNVSDGAEILYYFKNFNIKSFISRTLPREENIDLSVPGYDKKSERFFYASEINYFALPNHNIYGYFLIQKDYSNEQPEDSTHDYTYDSQYLGLGAEGKISDKLNYWMEIIKQSGKSRIYDTNEKKTIDSWALDCGISYDFNIYSHPIVSLEYAFGSGDKDRTSVTDTQNGNTQGKDTNFLYFGYIPTGYSLCPRLSNIRFYRIGVLLKPFEKITNFKRVTVGINYYRYYKDKSQGGIYDPEATQSNNDIGREIDFDISWHVLSDLRIILQYGHFIPGKSYPASTNNNQNYFSLSTTLTF